MIAHIDPQIPRDAIEEIVFGGKAIAILLPEAQRRKKRVQLVKLVIGERLERFIERDFVRKVRRELRPVFGVNYAGRPTTIILAGVNRDQNATSSPC